MSPDLRRSCRSRARDQSPESDANIDTRSKRRTRSTAAGSVTVSRSSTSTSDPPGESTKSLRVTVKMPTGKLREATGGRSGRRSVNVFRENPIVSGPRSSRTKKKLVEVATSDDDEDIDDQEEDEVEDEDAPGEDDEDADADGDVDMDDAPSQPPARRSTKAAAPTRGKTKSVEAKEMELEDEDEDEDEDDEDDVTDSDAEGEPDDQDESAVPDVNVDDLDEEDEDDDLDEDIDSDALALNSGKTTKRQRGNLGDDFLQLPMEPQVKKHLTAEERAMRRAEMARRRKNLSEKRNEEEKVNGYHQPTAPKTAPKRRGRGAVADADTTPAEQEAQESEKADPTMVRWVSNAAGCKLSVPDEWLGTPAGRIFGAPPAAATGTGQMVEEI
ncbi:hypothetical protein N7532_008433 [Penicillium argentinense]|uniref:INO80 complex subunit B-like conserved region domain-containing protein n=1 Tax=Penicillium argentinense TaxID=1131581 RepID=A0A9W9EXE3_9EURO|nr:uncharacterized protein N7532_008433 [Penicillium argentinense]KAJ5089749.1 hypothetical protein N7532_008433 [Penicillium argentinense]